MRLCPLRLLVHRLVMSMLLGLAGSCDAAAGSSSVSILSVTLDGTVLTPEKLGGAVAVPHGTRDVRIRLGPGGRAADSVRIRYQLKGFDSEWRDPPGEMRAVLHFLDGQDLEVGASAAFFSGTSSGWTGAVEDSPFREHVLDATAPARAAKAYVEFVSGGADRTVGVYAFRSFSLELSDPGGETHRLDFPIDTGEDLEHPLGSPVGWRRQGLNPAMAAVESDKDHGREHALSLRDVDSRSYCGWRLAPARSVAVREGTRLRARWMEAYSIGAGGPSEAAYRYLRPGRYLFEAAAAESSGGFAGDRVALTIIVRPPLWQEPWAWSLGAVAIGAVFAAAVRQAVQRRIRMRIAQLERERALESERARIAQDIHDDLGASLAQIAMLSELAQSEHEGNVQRTAYLDEIFTRAHAAGRKLDEIVWALNPAHDSAEDLVGYLAGFAQHHLRLARIRFRLDVPASLPEIDLTSDQRHQVFLAAKEALHNAVRHSGAIEITLRVRVERHELVVSVIDDGCGLPANNAPALSRGSATMLSRMEKLGGRFERVSSPAAGTTVNLRLPLSRTTA